MSLKPFTYPFPETRFFHTGLSVYKFKIRYGNSIRGEEIENKEVIIRELEDSVRVVLGNLDDLQPFATEHFIVFPYKSKWESVSHLKFKHGEVVLVPYPFVFILYVEMKWFPENLSPGQEVTDGSLGLLRAALGKEEPWEPGFPLKVLPEEKSPGTMMRKRRRAEGSSPPRTPGLDRARVGMSSQVPSKKKAPMKTRRNRERKSQQERQETPAFDSSDVREQGSECGDSQAGPLAPSPSPQRNSPPPPRAPAALRTTGFFGFLSTLFPFSYFFRRSSP